MGPREPAPRPQPRPAGGRVTDVVGNGYYSFRDAGTALFCASLPIESVGRPDPWPPLAVIFRKALPFGTSGRPSPTNAFVYRGAYHASGLRGGPQRSGLTSPREAFFALRAGFAGCATHAACGRCLLPFGQFTFWQSQGSFLLYNVGWFHKSVPLDCHGPTLRSPRPSQ